MRDQDIRRIMTLEPATVAAGDATSKARLIMESERINHLPVVDDGRLVGMVSSSDLLKLYLLDQNLESTAAVPVRQIMESKPIVLESSASLRDAAEKLSAGGFHSLPVVDADHRLVGIVTSTDLISHLLQQIPRGDGSLDETSAAKLQARNRILEELYRAAELYERSGHAEREHSALMKALDEMRAAANTSVNL